MRTAIEYKKRVVEIPGRLARYSEFGGKNDSGVGENEGLAFLPGVLARDLDPVNGWYVALPMTPVREDLPDPNEPYYGLLIQIQNPRTRRACLAKLVDRGPAPWTYRPHGFDAGVDCASNVGAYLKCTTGDCLQIGFPEKPGDLGPVEFDDPAYPGYGRRR